MKTRQHCGSGWVGDVNGPGSDEPTIDDIFTLTDAPFLSNVYEPGQYHCNC